MDAQKVRVDNEFAEGKPFKLFILKDKWDETKQILSRRVNVKTGMDDNAGDVGKIEDIDALNALEDLAGHKPTIKPSRVEEPGDGCPDDADNPDGDAERPAKQRKVTKTRRPRKQGNRNSKRKAKKDTTRRAAVSVLI